MPPPPATDGSCTLFRCFCCWRRVCSPRIPRVAPGRDYVCIPVGADDRPAWSLLVGFRADSGLRLHRFRVAPSGRILGRSNDALEIFHHIDSDRATPIRAPNATLSPDGRSLCIFCSGRLVDVESSAVVPTRALKLQLDDDQRTITQLPTVLLGRLMPCRPVTAAGDIWAPYFHLRPRSSCRLVMQRLNKNDGRWVEVGTIEFPYEMEVPMKWGGSIFQGYAVIHDTILVSLRPAHLFFSFNCSTYAWTAITATTTNTTSSKNTSIGTRSENTSIGTRSENTSTGNTTTLLDPGVWSSASIKPSTESISKNIFTDNTTSSINTSSGSTTIGPKKRSSRRKKKTSTGKTTSGKSTSTGNTTSGKDTSSGSTTSGKDTSSGNTTSGKDTSSGNTTSGKDTSSGNTTSGKDTSSGNTTSGKDTSSGNTTSGKETSTGKTTRDKDTSSANTTSGKDTSSGNTTSGRDTSSCNTILSLDITSNDKYVPICGRGVYVEEDDAIYFLQNSTIFAYKLLGRGQGQQPLVELKPPTKIDSICPFHPDGFGLLTHLGGRVICSVWISVGRDCSCDNYHVIISTFRVKYCSDGIPNGIEILHSTCRQLDMLPCKPTVLPTDEFCFLQEYEEYNHENAMEPSMLLEGIEDPTSSYGEDSSEMLTCCRKFLYKPPFPRCYVLQEPALQITTDLYVVCQAGSRLIVYWTEIIAGRLLPNCNYNPLRLHHDMNTSIRDSDCHAMMQPSPRYFNVRSLTSIYAVPYKPEDICEFELNRPSSNLLKTSRPAGVCFAVVLNVGHRIVAVSHALEVFWFAPPRSRFYGNRPAPTVCWKHCKTRGPDLVVNRRVVLSGYVVLDADTFIVSDKETCRCFLLNLNTNQWKDVLPDVKSRTLLFHDPLFYGRQRLNGRSIYVGGYIYSCTTRGLVAYDFHGGLLDDAISLPFPWRKTTWESERMCLDLVGVVKGAVVFCVVQGEFFSRPSGQDVYITIVQVKTTRTPVGKFRPVSIDHVDIATCFIPREDGMVSTRSCFLVEH